MMDGRQGFELRIPMAAYNFGAMLLNLYCFVEVRNSKILSVHVIIDSSN